jgi:hypothetical protein
MYKRLFIILLPALLGLDLGVAAAQRPGGTREPELFQTSSACLACHTGLTTPGGEDISIGFDWRASMMANSARDPYWQAAVRREIIDFPGDRATIENECSTCHMPMANVETRADGRLGEIFAHLPIGGPDTPLAPLAADGVSCTVCHQIQGDNFGQPESFTGGFLIDREDAWEERRIFGPFEVDEGRTRLMHSASAFTPAQGTHIQQSEMCATCHTLYTHALGPGGRGEQLPEQMPYLEWTNSSYPGEQTCQSCHMPVVRDSTAMSSVLGQPRSGVSRHAFVGGNFFMLRMLNRYRAELGVVALPQELEAAAKRTETQLQSSTANVSVERGRLVGNRLETVVRLENHAGHKLPTGYPSRRVWIEYTVRDAAGQTVFSSGALRPDGSIVGNDNDQDGSLFETHYDEIRTGEQVQIYESIMSGPDRTVTTGLLTGVGYLKDNRLLPRGFLKRGANPDVAVHGAALDDEDFAGGIDEVVYSVEVPPTGAPFTVEATLWYQPIGRRWAENLRAYDAAETSRFVGYYDAMSGSSAVALARGSLVVQ